MERLLATHEFVMTSEIILRQSFSESVGYLVVGINWEDIDEPLSHMCTKVMVTDIDMLGSRT